MVVGVQRYRKFNTFLRERFGEKVYRVGLCAELGCPNRAGATGEGGCIFCNPASSEPLGFVPGTSLAEQLDWGTRYVRGRHGAEKFIAYFSDYTATHADAGRLERLYREAIAFPGVVGLALSTRPDSLSPEILDLLQGLARETFLWVELGVQSAHDRSLEWMRRRHTVEDSRRAIDALGSRGLVVAAHVILGLPGESEADTLVTARFLGDSGVHGVKIHNLHVVEETPLADLYRGGELRMMTLDEYADLAVKFLESLPPTMIVQRVSGEAPRRLTVAPEWSINKLAVFNAVELRLEVLDTWQGRAVGASLEDLHASVTLPDLV